MIGVKIVDLVRSLWRELAKFGVVGVVNIVIDMGLYNVLIDGPMQGKITAAKVVSGAVATAFAWVGNRYWTFRHRRNRPVHHEILLFFVVNGIALGLSAIWVAFAHYSLGLEGKLWLNVNAIIGIGWGTIFRFWAYKKFVFRNEPVTDRPAGEAISEPLEHEQRRDRRSEQSV
ncbi:GtrA family protein [Flexivirga caeni]|uniref:GtrA family protein n=1 Tax=Flexivirga caeni TaxID=2294115 RepID=UPI001FE2CD77|nr:GtrA family protein [Flexivirga caeni]